MANSESNVASGQRSLRERFGSTALALFCAAIVGVGSPQFVGQLSQAHTRDTSASGVTPTEQSVVIQPSETTLGPTAVAPLEVAPAPTTTAISVATTANTTVQLGESGKTISRDELGAFSWTEFSSRNCACKVTLPFAARESQSTLGDGTPANLVTSSAKQEAISAGVWTAQVGEQMSVDQLQTVLEAVGRGKGTLREKRVVGSTQDPQLEAEFVNGQGLAKVNLRSTATHVYVIFVGSTSQQSVRETFGRVLQSFSAA